MEITDDRVYAAERIMKKRVRAVSTILPVFDKLPEFALVFLLSLFSFVLCGENHPRAKDPFSVVTVPTALVCVLFSYYVTLFPPTTPSSRRPHHVSTCSRFPPGSGPDLETQ